MGKIKLKRKNRTLNFKPLEINLNGSDILAPDLVSFEELTNCKVIRGKPVFTNYNDSENDEEHNRKKSKKRKLKNEEIEPITKKKKISDKDNSNKNKKKGKTNNTESVSKSTEICETKDSNAKKAPKKKKKNNAKSEANVHDSLENKLVDSRNTDESNEEIDVDMKAWNEFNLSEKIKKGLAAKKFTTPTKIQKLTLPEAIANKRDILGAAETGSGKTLAFAIPMVNGILELKKTEASTDKLFGLILTPTRELAIQIRDHIRDLCTFTDIKVIDIVGGMSTDKQIRKLNQHPEIIVATPGRLWELYQSGNEHLSQLENISFFTIDEADRMLENNHFTELKYILERVNSCRNNKKQTFVFSATLAMTHSVPSYVYRKSKGKKSKGGKITSEEKIEVFIKKLGLKNPAIIDISQQNVIASGIYEYFIHCTKEDKDCYLYYLLKMHTGKKMIFCNSVACVQRLHRLLNILQCDAKMIYANRGQKQRLKTMEGFKNNANSVIITSDVLARGVDIADIDYIIHYEVPKTAENYVHRSGRSVRGVGAEGTSILLCSAEESRQYEKIIKTLNKESKIPDYQLTSSEYMARSTELIKLSREIEFITRKVTNIQSNANSYEKMAREMDIILDDDEKPEKLNDGMRKSYQLRIKKLNAQLKALLTKPIFPRTESLRYPSFETVQSFYKLSTTK